MPEARWTNNSQPQTLQIAVFLLYADAFFLALQVLTDYGGPIDLVRQVPWGTALVLAIPAGVLAGRAIASEQKWGYYLGIAMAFFPFVFWTLYVKDRVPFATWRDALDYGVTGRGVISMMFEIALVVLLLHTHSREYQRVWFK